LLDPGVNGKWSAAGDRRHAHDLPSACHLSIDAAETAPVFEMKILHGAQRKGVSNIEGRWTLFSMGVEGILRVGLRHRTGCSQATGDRACIVDGLGPGIARLEVRSAMTNVSRE